MTMSCGCRLGQPWPEKRCGGGYPPPSQAEEVHQILPSTLTWAGIALEVESWVNKMWGEAAQGKGTETLGHLPQLDI